MNDHETVIFSLRDMRRVVRLALDLRAEGIAEGQVPEAENREVFDLIGAWEGRAPMLAFTLLLWALATVPSGDHGDVIDALCEVEPVGRFLEYAVRKLGLSDGERN